MTHGWASASQNEKEMLLWSREELGVNIAVCPRLQLISHTQQPSPFRELSVRDYIFIKKCVRSFIEVRHYVWLRSAYICICITFWCMWLYNIRNSRIGFWFPIFRGRKPSIWSLRHRDSPIQLIKYIGKYIELYLGTNPKETWSSRENIQSVI